MVTKKNYSVRDHIQIIENNLANVNKELKYHQAKMKILRDKKIKYQLAITRYYEGNTQLFKLKKTELLPFEKGELKDIWADIKHPI